MMKYCFLLIGFILCFLSCVRNQHGSYIEISKEMDWNQFENDLKFVNADYELPLSNGVFPVPKYESSGNGTIEEVIELCGVRFILQSVFVYKGDYNEVFFEGVHNKEEELVYFTVLVQSNIESLNEIMATSRNHPYYLGQGIIHLNNKKITWLATHNTNGERDMAIINMKYFDLKNGRLIVVFPMEDGSLRFKQIDVNQQNINALKAIILTRESDIYQY